MPQNATGEFLRRAIGGITLTAEEWAKVDAIARDQRRSISATLSMLVASAITQTPPPPNA